MTTLDHGRNLDFGPAGMRWEITRTGADTQGELFEAINIIAPGFAGPPLHIHPHAEEIYEVITGTLDVCLDGQWRQVSPGETVTVPAGTPHTLKTTDGEVRLRNVHQPAQEFERFFRRFHALVSGGQLQLPPKNLRSIIMVSLLFCAHPREIASVKPPQWFLKMMAFVGRVLGYKLPG